MVSERLHYEHAFRDYLAVRGVAHVCVNQSRRAIMAGRSVKSFDLLVYPPSGAAWLVDVKGRKFPYVSGGQKRYWENWITRDDLDGLSRWERTFGDGFRAQLVFAYWIRRETDRIPADWVHTCLGRRYAFLAMPIQPYEWAARERSPRWETVYLSLRDFRAVARPVHEMLNGNASEESITSGSTNSYAGTSSC